MTRHARTLAALALGVAAWSPRAAAQQSDRPTVAVVAFSNRGAARDARGVENRDAAREARSYDGLGTALADLLGAALGTNATVRVVDRREVQRLVDAQHLAPGGRIGREAAVTLGPLLGVQHVVIGGFTSDPQGNFRIDARAVDASTGAVEDVRRVQDRSDNLVALVGELAAQLSTGMRLGGAPMQTAAATRLPARQLVTYGRALELADQGDKPRASELLTSLLKEFPDFAPARAALSRLGSGS
jgi:hypothetical protein